MCIYIFSLCVAFYSSFAIALDDPLTTAVKEYETIQKDLSNYLVQKSPECSVAAKSDVKNSYCSINAICANPKVQSDSPFIYQNDKGEKIINENYYRKRNGIKACLKEKYADQIKEKREELAKKLGYENLKKIMDANKKLNKIVDRFNEGAKIQKISSEILAMSIESGLKDDSKGDPEGNEKDLPDQTKISQLINLAEKRTKTVLRADTKKTLIEIETLKKNTNYKLEMDKLEEKLLPDTGIQDPLFNWKLLTDKKAAGGEKFLTENRSSLIDKGQNAYGIFQDTQKEIIDYLNSIKNPSNTEKLDRIITRVNTIRFNSPRLTPTLTSACTFPNAFYDPDSHSVTLCPQMLNYPKMAIMETLAHEIAHSFDSCNFSGEFYKSRGPVVMEEAPFEADLNMIPILGNFKNTTAENLNPMDLKNRIQEKMLFKDNPFSKTLSCLQDSASVEAQAISMEKMKIKVQADLTELTHLGENNINNAKARALNYFNEHEEEYFNYFQGCDASKFGPLGNTQLQESFADKISSEIVARKLKTLNNEDAQKSILEITLSFSHICSNESTGETKLREFAIKEGCPDYRENMNNEERVLSALKILNPNFDKHPEDEKRIERIHLAHPEIRKAINCPLDSEAKYCE